MQLSDLQLSVSGVGRVSNAAVHGHGGSNLGHMLTYMLTARTDPVAVTANPHGGTAACRPEEDHELTARQPTVHLITGQVGSVQPRPLAVSNGITDPSSSHTCSAPAPQP
jgi:hypothetical protein